MTKKRRLPVKTRPIHMTDEWDGWNFTARINPTMGTLADLQGGDFDRMIPALEAMIIDWDFVDEAGNDLPQPQEGGIKHLTVDLLNVVTALISEKIIETPKG